MGAHAHTPIARLTPVSRERARNGLCVCVFVPSGKHSDYLRRSRGSPQRAAQRSALLHAPSHARTLQRELLRATPYGVCFQSGKVVLFENSANSAMNGLRAKP